MLHHVALEVDPAEAEACAEAWELLGFARVPVPASLGEGYTWLEREGTQIHLLHTASPIVPTSGHAAVVVADFEATLAGLAEAGLAPERRREHWGQPRASVAIPGGHRVELMAAPPG